ncbi:MAG: di-heme oxidoredictase family protein [Pseudobdellovibrio sp.]
MIVSHPLEEAILWCGSEAELSKKQFTELSKSDRDSVMAFLNSL